MKLQNTIIYLIGIPAVGKYTVAREIGRLTGAKVVDNQLINTPVFTVIGYDGTESFPFPHDAWKEIEKIRDAVITVIRDYCPAEASFVFTNVLDANVPGDRLVFERIEELAKQRNSRFVPVWLTCDADVIHLRKNNADRKARLKDIDLTSIPWWSNQFQVLKVDHPNALTLDTSHTSPAETAELILKHISEKE